MCLGQAGDALTGVTDVWMSRNGGYNWTLVSATLLRSVDLSYFVCVHNWTLVVSATLLRSVDLSVTILCLCPPL